MKYDIIVYNTKTHSKTYCFTGRSFELHRNLLIVYDGKSDNVFCKLKENEFLIIKPSDINMITYIPKEF